MNLTPGLLSEILDHLGVNIQACTHYGTYVYLGFEAYSRASNYVVVLRGEHAHARISRDKNATRFQNDFRRHKYLSKMTTRL